MPDKEVVDQVKEAEPEFEEGSEEQTEYIIGKVKEFYA